MEIREIKKYNSEGRLPRSGTVHQSFYLKDLFKNPSLVDSLKGQKVVVTAASTYKCTAPEFAGIRINPTKEAREFSVEILTNSGKGPVKAGNTLIADQGVKIYFKPEVNPNSARPAASRSTGIALAEPLDSFEYKEFKLIQADEIAAKLNRMQGPIELKTQGLRYKDPADRYPCTLKDAAVEAKYFTLESARASSGHVFIKRVDDTELDIDLNGINSISAKRITPDELAEVAAKREAELKEPVVVKLTHDSFRQGIDDVKRLCQEKGLMNNRVNVSFVPDSSDQAVIRLLDETMQPNSLGYKNEILTLNGRSLFYNSTNQGATLTISKKEEVGATEAVTISSKGASVADFVTEYFEKIAAFGGKRVKLSGTINDSRMPENAFTPKLIRYNPKGFSPYFQIEDEFTQTKLIINDSHDIDLKIELADSASAVVADASAEA